MLTASVKLNRSQERLLAAMRGVPVEPTPAFYDWNGRPFNHRNMGEQKFKDPKGPVRCDSVIEVILKNHRLLEARPEDVLMAHWQDVIGDAHASQCRPVKITRETLLVAAANAMVRSELMFKRRSITDRLRQIPGFGGIKEIRFSYG